MALVSLKYMLVCFVALLVTRAQAAGPIVTDLWIQFATPSDPPAVRYSHSAVFNPVFGNMIVFGGIGADNTIYNDISTYTVETSEWATTVETFGIPPLPRYGHSAVATGLNRMVVFGGRNDTMMIDEVVVFDMVSMTWMNISVTGTPPSARAYHTAVVDRYQHVMYVYGGSSTGEDVLSDMYMLDLDQYVWSVVPSEGAQARAMHSALMTLQGVMVVFGGVGLSDVACFDVRNQTWYACVTQESPAPAVRYGHTAVYSPLQQMVIYGGRNDAGNPVNDVWNFDLNEFRWYSVAVGGYPINPRAFHSAVATTFGTMIVFGGVDGDGMTTNDFGLYNLANTVLHSANDGAVLVVMVTLLGTIVLGLCFAMDYMHEQNEIEKSEAMEKAKQEALLLPKLPPIPKALQIPLGPRAQRFFDEFKMSLDPMQDPPK